MKILITTLVTSIEYLRLAQVLAHGIKCRYHSKYDVKIMITQNVKFTDQDWIYHAEYDIIPYLEYNTKGDASKEERVFLEKYRTTINKFWVLTYENYDKIVFIDADSFVIGDIDKFIENAIDKYNVPFIGRYRDGDTNNINSGIFIVEPNRDLYFTIIDKYKFKVTDDETILYSFFNNYINSEMHDYIFNNNCIIHTGSNGKLLLMFPNIVRDLMLCDDRTYELVIRTWITYRQNHLLLDNSPEDRTFDYWWKL